MGDERGNVDTKVVVLVRVCDDTDVLNGGDDVSAAEVGVIPIFVASVDAQRFMRGYLENVCPEEDG